MNKIITLRLLRDLEAVLFDILFDFVRELVLQQFIHLPFEVIISIICAVGIASILTKLMRRLIEQRPS